MTYAYQALEQSELRLLVLLPGSFYDPLAGHLKSHRLLSGHDTAQTYEALSYVWGDQSEPKTIKILKHDEDQHQARRRGDSRPGTTTPRSLGKLGTSKSVEISLPLCAISD